MPGGRPKKTFEDAKKKMPKDWDHQIISLYSKGGSDVEIRGLLIDWLGSASFDLWERWLNEEPEFSQTIKRGRIKSQVWWESLGRTQLVQESGKDATTRFDTTLWYMNMKNRFKWTDRQDNTSGDKPMTSEKITVEILNSRDETQSD